jgi:hypothetical protein
VSLIPRAWKHPQTNRSVWRLIGVFQQARGLLDNLENVMEELAEFTLLTRGVAGYRVGRYSERKDSGETDPARESGPADLNVLRVGINEE